MASIHTVRSMFDLAAITVLRMSFSKDISEEYASKFVHGYEKAWEEMENQLIKASPPTPEREKDFQKALKQMREVVKDVRALSSKEKEEGKEEKESVGKNFLGCLSDNKHLYPTDSHISDEAITACAGGKSIPFRLVFLSFTVPNPKM